MSNWRFDDAQTAMAEAETVISARDALAATTTELGLPMPGELEPAYESAATTADLTALDARIADWTTAAAAIRTTGQALARERPPLVTLGLFDSNPRSGYDAAVAAFAAGDAKAVMAGTASTIAALDAAQTIGQGRATTAGLAAAVVFLLLVLLVIVLVRRRRRHRPSTGTSSLAWASASGVMVDDVPPAPTEVRFLGAVAEPPAGAPPSVAPPPLFETADVPPPPDAVRRLDTAPSASPGDGSGLAAADPYATLAATPNGVDDVPTEEPGARGAEPD